MPANDSGVAGQGEGGNTPVPGPSSPLPTPPAAPIPGFDHAQFLTLSGDGRNFILARMEGYTDKAGVRHEMQPGSGSDGASSPRFIWSIVPPFGKYWRPAYFHDWLYGYDPRQLPKDQCDELFLEAMLIVGVYPDEAEALYKAVQDGGQSAFDEDRKHQGGIK